MKKRILLITPENKELNRSITNIFYNLAMNLGYKISLGGTKTSLNIRGEFI